MSKVEVQLKYGTGYKRLQLPDSAEVTVFKPRELPPLPHPDEVLKAALAEPLEAAPLNMRTRPASVAIAVPDETRPAPLKLLLPVLLQQLFDCWPDLQPRDVVIIVGGGLHPAPDQEQLQRILPDVRGCRVESHDAVQSPMARLGFTSRGTLVEINASFAAADLKIVLGMIDPHQFQGMTGGAKGVAIGCASKDMIRHNHSLMVDPAARVGNIKDNPARLDIDEAGRIIGIDLAVNVCLSPAKEPMALFAGDPEAVLAAGAAVSEQVYGLPFEEYYDIVVASCGGYPKDICLYQAQKGLNMASQCAVEHGRILLLAACGQGVGDHLYHDYVRRFSSPEEQMRDFSDHGFRMGAHKAFLFSRSLTRFEVVVESELDAATLAGCHLRKGEGQAVLDAWLHEAVHTPRIAVVPNANTTYFYRSGK